ncbi:MULTISPECIES: efflux transporter outer membrane subunit [unclassified Duganella]|uniref:efflux transporter outer membrane subunit n=1 Tax=unclassified Duganella TaxID=2636909 RepID=UPI0008860E90|nr:MULTISPECIES: efflux transporter outer membrane subunit [unclassified Duganella]SDH13670.1 efflux transporter, outer membrane factor (OMF) lipoprotein, NodT family [Duganella sp. OV458]SDK28273.1 efflux transporter, outer membrane factor (OMF) lipoprotein, NodT family [Duganella sp. OV510]
MNALKLLGSVALAAALAACTTVGPNYTVPAQAVVKRPEAAAPFLGTQEAAYKSEPLPTHWWRLYDDPVLDQLVQKALAANTDLRVASANLARTRAVLDQTEEERKPEVSVSASPGVGRSSGVTAGSKTALPDRFNYDAGIHVSYQTDMFGKIARAVEAANADTQAAQAAVDLVRVTVAADTARAYADACAAVRQISVAQQSVDLQQKFVELTDQRTHAGRGTAIDGARARSQLAQLQAALPPLQAQHRTAHYRLAALTGQTPAEMNMHLLQCQAAPRLTTQIPVGDGAALLRRRPDIRQAERNLAAATARIGVATADLYPNISIGASVGSTGLLDHVGAGNAFRWSLGPLISWTLPDTGAARSRIAQAQAGSDGALAKFDGTVLNALKEAESALTVYARELDRNVALKTARDESAQASEQSHRLYQYGRIDFLSVLDADRTLAATDAAWAASDAALASDQIALFLALGGGWEK